MTAPAPTTPQLSVGIDTVRVSDVLASLHAFGSRYLDRVFTEHEQRSCVGSDDVRARALAGRFAAKEAAYKALRPDDLAGAWTSIEIRRDTAGRCDVALHGAAAEHAHRTGVRELSVSLTHDGDTATAVVVALHDTPARTAPARTAPARTPDTARHDTTQGRSDV